MNIELSKQHSKLLKRLLKQFRTFISAENEDSLRALAESDNEQAHIGRGKLTLQFRNGDDDVLPAQLCRAASKLRRELELLARQHLARLLETDELDMLYDMDDPCNPSFLRIIHYLEDGQTEHEHYDTGLLTLVLGEENAFEQLQFENAKQEWRSASGECVLMFGSDLASLRPWLHGTLHRVTPSSAGRTTVMFLLQRRIAVPTRRRAEYSSLEELPLGLLLVILSRLDARGLRSAMLVCKRWHRMINQAVVWNSLWRNVTTQIREFEEIYTEGNKPHDGLPPSLISNTDAVSDVLPDYSELIAHPNDARAAYFNWLAPKSFSRLLVELDDLRSGAGGMQHIKVVIVGDPKVGKSKLFSIGSEYWNASYEHRISNKVVNLGVWDTKGSSLYDRLRPLSYPPTDIFVLMFSVIVPASLEHVRSKWYPEFRHHLPNTSWILLGTMADLRDAVPPQQRVTTEIGIHTAIELGASAYIECGSLQNTELGDIFDIASRVVLCPVLPPGSKRRCAIQ
jgi:small GTP-binding protein